jgi:non-heme chloroperoxidase
VQASLFRIQDTYDAGQNAGYNLSLYPGPCILYLLFLKMRLSMKKKAVSAVYLILWLVAGLSLFAKEKDKPLWKDSYQEVGDIKIHYLDTVTGDRILIFIPGWTMTADVWKEQIPYFSARGFRVIALDPRSHGATTKTENGNTYQQHAADLHEFLQTLKIEHSYLVAAGSGVLSLLDYISSPEALKPEKIVFVEGSPSGLKMDDCPGTITLQQARRIVLGLQDDRAKATEQYIRSLFKQRPLEMFVADTVKASMKTPLSATLSLFFDYVTGDRRSVLPHVPVPTLIVTTPENRAVGEYMKGKIPRANLEVIDGAGSALYLDKPQAFNQVLEEFFGEH